MKSGDASKELYKQLRAMPWGQLWTEEVPRFNAASARERFERVAVVRAVGVVFSESGPRNQKVLVVQWLRGLLHDPEEKIRRYAMTALPKIGVSAEVEAELLALLPKSANPREEKYLTETLGKIGGAATVGKMATTGNFSPKAEQRVKARVARDESPSHIRLESVLTGFDGMRIHLRGRLGLEEIVAAEVEEQGKFDVVEVLPGLVAILPPAKFTLADLFALRCFGTVGFVVNHVPAGNMPGLIEALAASIASPLTEKLLGTLTEGTIRYRIEFIGTEPQRGAVRMVADRAYALCPRMLNDTREAPWAVDIHRTPGGDSVELRPRLSPDPRHAYRLDDVPAASHPPLAACLARVAGVGENDAVWDPFCGSGLELIERARRGGVRSLDGTDHSAAAIEIARKNLAAAQMGEVKANFACTDFREFARAQHRGRRQFTQIITNPPLGRRVRIENLPRLIGDLFAVAADLLAPGGLLVFTNPLRLECPERSLRREFRQVVDMGGFDCWLECYRKTGP